MFNIIDSVAIELANWDFWSLSALIIILLGISEKFPFVGLGFSIFIYKILGNYWCSGFVIVSVLFICINWFKCNQIENSLSLIGNGFDCTKEEIEGIREECEKIRKTINPHDLT